MFRTRLTVDNGTIQRRNQGSSGLGRATASVMSKSAGTHTETSGTKETANFGSPLSVGVFGGSQYNTMFRGIIPDNAGDDSQLGTMLRDIWHYDNVGGTAVDLQCGLAFSNWTLSGLKPEESEVYNDALARLNMRVMLPQISRNYLVDGAFIGTLLWEKETKTFQDILIHDRFNATISPQPFFSMDPTVVVNSASNLQQFFATYSPYAEATLKGYPQKILDNFMRGSNVLDPITTLMVLRKGTQDASCVSYLRRLLPMYMLEKTLFRGTLTEASKRQRATTQIAMGDDTWEPTDEEMMLYTQKFQMADMDPLGAWVATRQGVTLSDVRPAGEIWKWTDSADVLVPYKLRALGLSEAFMSSDATFANAEASVTMFMDNLDTYREYLTYRIFYAKLFPLIAVLNGMYKNKKEVKDPRSLSNLMFNMGNQKNLNVPKIQWHKKLESPNVASLMENLDKLNEKGFPVALKTWAAAANIDLASAMSDLQEDSVIRDQISAITGKPVGSAPGAGNSDDLGGDSEEATFRRVLSSARKSEVTPMNQSLFRQKAPGLLDREFGGDFKFTKTGKPIPSSARESRTAQETLVKAVKSLSDPHRASTVRNNMIARLGSIPRIGW